MKTAKAWVKENSQSGAFDTVSSIAEAEELVRQIQQDAINKDQATTSYIVEKRTPAAVGQSPYTGYGLDGRAPHPMAKEQG